MSIDRNTVEQIIAFLSSSDQTNDERMAEHARQYAQATEVVNTRLVQCQMFLNSGHRSQALRHAEMDPDINEQIKLLSLKGMVDVWQEAIGTYGWTRFHPIKSDIAESLNEAYSSEKEVEDLLSHYRELNLARAPLGERLPVLRQIASLDPTNPTWTADIEYLEKGLMKQLADRGHKALSAGDFGDVIELVEHHDAQDWQIPLDNSYKAFIQESVPKVYLEHSLPKLGRRMCELVKKKEFDEVGRLKADVEEKLATARTLLPEFQPDPETHQLIEAAFKAFDNWNLANRKRAFGHDLNILRSMLQGKHSEEQILEAKARAESHGFALPPTDIADVDACLHALKDNRILRTMAIVSLIVLVVALVIIAYMLFVRLTRQNSQEEENAASREHLVCQVEWQGHGTIRRQHDCIDEGSGAGPFYQPLV